MRLGVSAGFAAAGDEWHGDDRRVRRALLSHVALVAEAARSLPSEAASCSSAAADDAQADLG